MRVITGLGNIPPVRRWETARVVGTTSVPLPTAYYDRGRLERPAPFFTPAFRMEAAGYGAAPRANSGEAIAALRGLSGIGDWWNPMTWGEKVAAALEPSACEMDVKNLRTQVTNRLVTASPALKETLQGALSASANPDLPCETRKATLIQALAAAINEVRLADGRKPLSPEDMALTGGAGGPRESFWDNFYKDGKLTPLGIGAIVGGGLLVAAIGTGTAGALLGRRR